TDLEDTMDFPILSAVIFLPALGALAIMFVKREEIAGIRAAALTTSIVTFVASAALFFLYRTDAASPRFQFAEAVAWVPRMGIRYAVAVDGVSLLLVLLTTFLTPIAILASWRSIEKRQKEFFAALLLLESGVLGVFAATDLL